MRNCVKRKKNWQKVVQSCCCCCAPTFHHYVVSCNIFVSWQSYLTYVLTYLLTYISSTIGCANFGPDWPLLFNVNEQWRRSVVKSEGVRVTQVKPSN